MIKKEIIFTVLEKLNTLTDDSNISEELVSSMIDTKRAMLLKQQYATKSWHLPVEVKQELCMSLELVEKVEGYSCAGKILATTVPVPRSIKIRGRSEQGPWRRPFPFLPENKSQPGDQWHSPHHLHPVPRRYSRQYRFEFFGKPLRLRCRFLLYCNEIFAAKSSRRNRIPLLK